MHKTAQYVCLIGQGNPNAEIMFIGEAPGQREDESGKAFVGRAGQILDLILEHVGLSRNEIYISNSVKCRPPDNRDPSKSEVFTCSTTYLQEEIKLIDPKLIVCLGRWATLAILGDQRTIELSRRKIFKSQFGNADVIVTYHPAICLYPGKGPQYGTVIGDDIRWGIKYIRTGGDETKTFLYVSHIKSFQEVSVHTHTFSLDLEMNGKDTYDPGLRIVSAAASPKWAFSVFRYGEEKALDLGRRLVSKEENVIIGSSIKSDLKWLRLRGLKRSEFKARIRDSVVMASICDENYPTRKLEHLAVTRLGALPWKKEEIYAMGMDQAPVSEVREINCQDAIWNRAVYFDLLKEVRKQKLEKTLDLDMNTVKTLVEVELHGMQIDQKVFKELCETYARKMKILSEKIGIANVESTQQVSVLLFETLGLVPPEGEVRGKNGFYSTREEVLKKLANDHKMVKRLLRYRMYATRKKMFLDGLEGNGGIFDDLDANWRIHPTYNVAKVATGGGEKDSEGGTTSGRLSCKNPNLQQAPRKQDDIPHDLNIKRMFISRWDGGEVGSIDYRQGEVYLAASESNDQAMLEMLASGEDFHRAAASKYFKINPDQVTTPQRKSAKSGVFCVIYRGGAWKLARSLNLTIEDAEQWWHEFKRLFKGFEQWARDAEETIIHAQQIRVASGRLRHLPGASKSSPQGRELIRSGINACIQGLLADITKHAMNLCNTWLFENRYKTKVCGNIHDEVLFDFYPGERNNVLPGLVKIFRAAQHDIYDPQIPLDVEAEVGPNLCDVKTVDLNQYGG